MTTPHALSPEQRLFYETNGYLVFPEALTTDKLAQVRAAADRAESLWRADPARLGNRGPKLHQVQAIIEYDDLFLDLMEHPQVFPVVRELIGEDVVMIDNDYFITPPRVQTHAHWHVDVGLPGIYHPRSTLMVKVFWLLTNVPARGGGTALLPGSFHYPMDFQFPKVEDPAKMPGAVRMEYPAGTAYLFNGRTYHAALNNETDHSRRVLIFNYGHFWMKPWQGYEPSAALQARAATPVRRQLLHLGEAYGQSLANGQ